ncbi:MAG TPA: helical backbone metal receptor [Cytophagales bacterium]|nr:helical backbone metal receptor [Cytophagales bacterium]
MGREIRFSFPPKRIISLVPSQTELLFDLGLGPEVVGITKFCVHPIESVKSVTKIGGTKKFNFARIEALNPDLIIGNKEENYEEGIKALSEKYPVWMSDIYTLPDAYEMMLKVGAITGRVAKAREIKTKIEKSFKEISSDTNGKVAYIIWKDPIMVAGKNTFIHEMLKAAGFENAFEHLSRYPVVTFEDLKITSPDFIFLSSEPYPFKEKHIKEFTEVSPEQKIKLVDGEIFSWYGSRLLKAVSYFHNLNSEFQK